jgi:RPA family protein
MTVPDEIQEETPDVSNYERARARWLLAPEFNDIALQWQEETGNETRWALSPTGVILNRVYFAGVATSKTEKDGTYRLTVSDLTNEQFYTYAHQDSTPVHTQNIVKELSTDDEYTRVGVVGKVNVYEKDDGGATTSVFAENIQKIKEAEQRAWLTHAAARTIQRCQQPSPPVSDKINSILESAYSNSTNKYEREAKKVVEKIHPDT